MDYHPCQHIPTLLVAYVHHIRHLEGFVICSNDLGSSPDFAHNTIRGYKSSMHSLIRYMNGYDIELSKLDYRFIEGYYTYQRTVEKLKPNSAYKNIKHLYRVIKICMLNKWLTDNPFKDFPCKYKNPIRPYLTETEIQLINNHVFPTDKLIRVRDLFMVLVYTGLSYADISNLTTENIEIGVNSKEWIIINRHKTGERSAIPLLPVALEIFKKYGYKLPYYSNQKFNEYLKDIAKVCGISKKLTTHIGRHTFATTICLSHGVPIETVSKLLGHSSLVTTQIYAKVTDWKTANDMSFLM